MATKKSKYSGSASDNDTAKAVSDSAQKIWLAGLGAFERAKAEGPKMFDVLVEQGKGLAERARGAADQAMKSVRDNANGASGRFDKLEQVFEERISKSLGRLGVMTRGEVSDLSNQVRELSDNVREMMANNARGGAAPKGGGTAKRRASAKAGGAKRKVKRAVSSAKRSVAQRTRKARSKAKRAAP